MASLSILRITFNWEKMQNNIIILKESYIVYVVRKKGYPIREKPIIFFILDFTFYIVLKNKREKLLKDYNKMY